MKRLLSVILSLIMALFMSFAAGAESNTEYWLEDLGMSIYIPSEYIAFTRDIDDNDPNLSACGLEKSYLSDLFELGDIYLDAWDRDVNFEILVTMTESTISDFNLISDSTLTLLASRLDSEYESYGITIEKTAIYQHEQAKFIKIYAQTSGEDTAYVLQFYTTYDNKAINISLRSNYGRIDAGTELDFTAIVDSVHFDKEPQAVQAAQAAPDTEAFTYTDKDTGVEFTVPSNWVRETLSDDSQDLDAMFASNKDPGMCIAYASADIWSEVPFYEKIGSSRADINNSAFTPDELAKVLDIPKNELTSVRYNGKEYYKRASTELTAASGEALEISTTYLMRIENGYVYAFQFSGDESNLYYGDFEALLKSVKYPAGESTVSSGSDTAGMLSGLLLSLLITVSVYSLPIIIYRFCIAKKPLGKAAAKKITIIYGLAAFIVMSVLIIKANGNGTAGGAVLLWSAVNYKVLTGGGKKAAESSCEEAPSSGFYPSDPPKAEAESREECSILEAADTPQSSQAAAGAAGKDRESSPAAAVTSAPKAMYCRHCGSKLVEGSRFCGTCGARIEEEG